MIKNVIAPIQAWLLSQGRCVGCSQPLTGAKEESHKLGKKITCKKCGRIYIKDDKGHFRRALISEV